MNLTLEPETILWPETNYVFLEKTGPILQIARQAWQEVHRLEALISEHNQITGVLSLYRMDPATYRAGYILAAPPVKLPAALRYEHLGSARYLKFVLTGSYANLPQASGRVWEYVSRNDILVRPDFAIERYANDPKSTPEDELITEILVPI
jgi:effector-binding domain-containing protein